MGKILYFWSLLLIVFLVGGSYIFPQDTIMWFASVSDGYNMARIGFGLLLLTLLVTTPPRHLIIRLALASTAVGLGAWTLSEISAYHMLLLDSVLYIELSLVFAVAALEYTPDAQQVVQLRSHTLVRR